jgi:hypothetical protein
MCRVLGVSRSSYYAWLDRPASQHTQQDVTLSDQIRTIYQDSRRYGSRASTSSSRYKRACPEAVARLMQEQH